MHGGPEQDLSPLLPALVFEVFLPECVANGFRFALGAWGLGHVRSTLLLRPQPSATGGDDGRPCVECFENYDFGGLKRCKASSMLNSGSLLIRVQCLCMIFRR